MAESEFRKGKITISLHFYFKQKKKKDRDYLNTLKLGLHSQSLMFVGSVGCRYVI